ncbi:hypothetical protein AGMMS49531_07580 [Endomicrobiia bacterium]|nr:hypothetical protein AGMMS49531_07580 [Endomicrobiia bacterium]
MKNGKFLLIFFWIYSFSSLFPCIAYARPFTRRMLIASGESQDEYRERMRRERTAYYNNIRQQNIEDGRRLEATLGRMGSNNNVVRNLFNIGTGILNAHEDDVVIQPVLPDEPVPCVIL